jgi:hypothetical protein
MTDSMLTRTEALRQEAYEALHASEQFRAFKALDDAVAAMGGARQLAAPVAADFVTSNGVVVELKTLPPVNRQRQRKRLSQGDGAEIVLKQVGAPVASPDLIDLVAKAGIEVSSGPNRLANFGSTLSRDSRFCSIRREGVYYWWLTGVDLPPFENEAPGLLGEEQPGASSVSSNQEGGDAHAATTA